MLQMATCEPALKCMNRRVDFKGLLPDRIGPSRIAPI